MSANDCWAMNDAERPTSRLSPTRIRQRHGWASWALLVASLGVAVLMHRPALACQSTTCDLPVPDAGCVRDSTSSCWLNGVPLHWASGCASFSIFSGGIPSRNLDYTSTEALVATAFGRWSQASCGSAPPSINVAPLGPVECQSVEFNPEGPNANVIVFYDEGWPHDSAVLGLTTLKFSTVTGEISSADMEIQLTPALDNRSLEFVVTHEAGHFLGLAHSADPSSVMFARYDPLAAAEATLSADDNAAICSAYNPGAVADCNFTPHRGFAPECGGDVVGGCSLQTSAAAPRMGSGGFTWLAAGGAAWLLQRRARRRR